MMQQEIAKPICAVLLCLFCCLESFANAADLPCDKQSQISESFSNGAAWQMCWQSNTRENLVLSQVSYRPANGEFYRVMGSMRLSQLHVTYDDSNVTYNDVTQYGLGGEFTSRLSGADCPGGQLLPVADKPGVCINHQGGTAIGNGRGSGDQFRLSHEHSVAESFTVSSVSQVGSYAYIISWQFFADGRLYPSIGAAGALQRSSNHVDSPYGRPLEGVADKSWLSHTHNYYWRLDFDLGEQADDDYVREHSVVQDVSGRQSRQQTRLDVEAARATAAEIYRSWEILDAGSAADPEQQIAYTLEPVNQGHKHVRAEREPYTRYDFFVTRQNDCERFASQNARFNPGCADDVLAFVNGESLRNADIVLWHRVSFHHVPRNEDNSIMHSHWDGFMLQPRYLHPHTPGHSGHLENTPPVVFPMADQQHTLYETVSIPIQASAADGDPPHLTAEGLPPGITLTDDALLQGSATQMGVYAVTLTASDGLDYSTTTFGWTISAPAETATNSGKRKSGSMSCVGLLLLGIFYLPLRRRFRHRQPR